MDMSDTVERTRTNCPLLGSELCDFAGCEGCDKCFMAEPAKGSDPQKLMDSWRVTLHYLPDDVDRLHTSDDCWFCKGEEKGKKGSYALVDLAHPEPAHMKGMFFGLGKKVRSHVGSLVQLPIGICPQCAQRMRMVNIIRWGCIALGLVLALVVGLVPAIANALSKVHFLLPLVAFVLLIVAGFVAGKLASANYQKKAEEKTEFDVFKLPYLSEMKSKGWFGLQDEEGTPHIFLIKDKPRPHMMLKRVRTEEEGTQEVPAQTE